MERINLNSNEKTARHIAGLENGDFFTMNTKNAENLKNIEAISKAEDEIETKKEEIAKQSQKLAEAKLQSKLDFDKLEMKALYNYVIIKPYEVNPFQNEKVTKSGLILNSGGLIPEHLSHETGEVEKDKEFVRVGTIIDCGPETKYAKAGDSTMWVRPAEVPLPYYREGWVLVQENRLLSILNEGLEERFKKYGR